MKKFTLLLMSVIASFATIAQTTVSLNPAFTGEKNEVIHQVGAADNSIQPFSAGQNGKLAAAGDLIWKSTFDTASKWTAQANGTTRGWQIGSTNHPWYSTQGIASTSGADWAALKPGDPRAGALTAADFNLTSNAINCSGKNSVILNFEQRYVRFEDTALVQVSTDGINFTTVYDNFWLPLTTAGSSNPSANPVFVTVNVSKIAANQASVYVRFRWKSRTQTQPGIGYGWWIDDVSLTEGENNDMVMEEMYWRPYTDSTYIHYSQFYTQIPNKQARKYPLRFGAKFSNLGGATQPNAGFNAVVTGPNNFSQTESASIVALSSLQTDSASTTNDITLAGGVGDYHIDLVAKSDSALKLNQDDTVGGVISVTDDIYARDNNDTDRAGAFYYNPANVWEWEIGVLYELQELDTLKAVQWVNPLANKRRANKTGKVSVHVYNAAGYSSTGVGVPATAPIFSSQPMDIKDLMNDAPGNSNWITTPVTRVGGGTGDTIGAGNYIVTLKGDQNFGTDTVFWPVQQSEFVNTQYFLRIAQAGAAMGNWSLGGRKYMIRMVTAPTQCPTLVGATTSSTATTACGNSDGEAEVVNDPTNGAGSYSYRWLVNGSVVTGKKITGLKSGNYTVTITDANGCSAESTVGVSDFGAPSVTLDAGNSVTTTTCFGDRQGKIEIDVTAGSNPNPTYTYTWTKAGTTGNLTGDTVLSNLEAGTYQVAVNDGSNPPCTQTLEVTIVGPLVALAANTAVDDILCKGDAVGTITVVASGGTPGTGTPYSISWSDGNTSFNRTNLTGGNYLFTVTDGNNCTLASNQNIAEPNNVFEITDVEYIDPGNTGNASIIDDSNPAKIELTVKAKGGYTSTIDKVQWKNPSGKIIASQTSDVLIIDPSKTDRDVAGDYTAVATSFDGCVSAPKVFSVDATSAIYFTNVEEFGTASSLMIYPNPASDMINVKFNGIENGTYTITLSNVVGQVIYSNSVESNGSIENTISVADADKGVYFLNISNGTSEVSKKIIVE